LVDCAKEFGVSLSAVQVDKVLAFTNELLRWNKKINLTGSEGFREIVMNQVLDSIVPIPQINDRKRFVDVGTGGGFPGVPIKIVCSDIEAVLIESRRKRASFLNHVVTLLGLEKVEVVWGRVGETDILKRFSSRPFDLLISRAAMDDRSILDAAGGLLRDGGRIVLMKGSLTTRVVRALEEECARLGWLPPKPFGYRLPGMERERNLVIVDRG
jgi:16S rRNA (guanine527-N7)-methyltransferase